MERAVLMEAILLTMNLLAFVSILVLSIYELYLLEDIKNELEERKDEKC